jgi:hypothetical protein
LGEVLAIPLQYKMVIVRKLEKHTHKHHTTTNMSGSRPGLRQLCPSATTTDRGVKPPNHRAATPLQVGAGCEPSGLRSPAPVPLLGRQNGTHENERGGRRIDLNGRRSLLKHNNQINDGVGGGGCIGEEMRMGGMRGGWH